MSLTTTTSNLNQDPPPVVSCKPDSLLPTQSPTSPVVHSRHNIIQKFQVKSDVAVTNLLFQLAFLFFYLISTQLAFLSNFHSVPNLCSFSYNSVIISVIAMQEDCLY